jgi:hypothetical protein
VMPVAGALKLLCDGAVAFVVSEFASAIVSGVPSLFTYTPGPTIVLPAASTAETESGIVAEVPAVPLAPSETASDATTPLNVTLTAFAVFATIVCVSVPVESSEPPPFKLEYRFTANVSLPTGDVSVPVQVFVQFTVTGVAVVPPCVTESVADCVDADT